jgi:hypothetical protein
MQRTHVEGGNTRRLSCARQGQTSAKVSKGRCGQEQARAGGVPGRSGRRLFQPAALLPSRVSSTALGGVAADAVASGSRLAGALRGIPAEWGRERQRLYRWLDGGETSPRPGHLQLLLRETGRQKIGRWSATSWRFER